MRRLIFNADLGSGKSDFFEDLYFELSNQIVQNGDRVGSRNGLTTEFLNFKTIVGDPRARCVGGYKRDINVFFLLAEAMWIWAGKKDVGFLTIFNKRMADYSDNGVSFHAPYGYRLRNYGVHSNLNDDGRDQLLEALVLLKTNPEDRRVVLNIWNPDLDLGAISKDLPCNDTLMFKIRNNKLYQTIQNRSNDLHWGLPTNVFQFSFIGEIMSKILDVELGQQVHNSQSLHCYMNNELTEKISFAVKTSHSEKLYDTFEYSDMDFKFVQNLVIDDTYKRTFMVTELFESIITSLTQMYEGDLSIDSEEHEEIIHSISRSSDYFSIVYQVLSIYVNYSKSKRMDTDRLLALERLLVLKRQPLCQDYIVLGMNFFVSRLSPDSQLPEGVLNLNLSKTLGQL